jgi:low affinity Fe/Cu permease
VTFSGGLMPAPLPPQAAQVVPKQLRSLPPRGYLFVRSNWRNNEQAVTRFAGWCAWAFGHPLAFILACLATLAWAVTGPVFNYSDTWQLVINTGTTVATFLMIFVLQHSQNRDATAIQAKLDELILVSEASNKLIRAEQLTEEEVEQLRCDPLESQEQKRALNGADIAI